MRVPTMSDGTRSGVNCTRANVPPTTCAKVRTASVLATPGTPSIRQCPLASRETISVSTMCSWPTMIRLISLTASLITCDWCATVVVDSVIPLPFGPSLRSPGGGPGGVQCAAPNGSTSRNLGTFHQILRYADTYGPRDHHSCDGIGSDDRHRLPALAGHAAGRAPADPGAAAAARGPAAHRRVLAAGPGVVERRRPGVRRHRRRGPSCRAGDDGGGRGRRRRRPGPVPARGGPAPRGRRPGPQRLVRRRPGAVGGDSRRPARRRRGGRGGGRRRAGRGVGGCAGAGGGGAVGGADGPDPARRPLARPGLPALLGRPPAAGPVPAVAAAVAGDPARGLPAGAAVLAAHDDAVDGPGDPRSE